MVIVTTSMGSLAGALHLQNGRGDTALCEGKGGVPDGGGEASLGTSEECAVENEKKRQGERGGSRPSPPAKKDRLSYKSDDRTLYHLPPRALCETYNTDERYDLDALEKQLSSDGVVVLPNVFSPEQIASFRRTHEKNFARVERLVAEQRRQHPTPPLKPLRHDFDKKRYYLMPHYVIHEEDTGESTEVIEISPGRLDYTFGMNGGGDDEESSDDDDDGDVGDDDGTNIDTDARNPFTFGSAEFQRPRIVAELMHRMLKADFRSYAGTLTSAGKSAAGPWHRDAYLLFDDETVDIRLPPYYLTVLIPLVTVDAQNGATEFLKGSHKQTCREALELQHQGASFQPCAQPGSAIVFDGRICHRGGRNCTEEPRTVLYQVWTKMWYDDY